MLFLHNKRMVSSLNILSHELAELLMNVLDQTSLNGHDIWDMFVVSSSSN
jgi:hypothetical protein